MGIGLPGGQMKDRVNRANRTGDLEKSDSAHVAAEPWMVRNGGKQQNQVIKKHGKPHSDSLQIDRKFTAAVSFDGVTAEP